MRTGLFLLSGFLLLAGSLTVGRLFSSNYPAATNAATVLFLLIWLVIAAEVPIFALIFAVPAAAAVLVRWKFL
jgi:hypothetical protein